MFENNVNQSQFHQDMVDLYDLEQIQKAVSGRQATCCAAGDNFVAPRTPTEKHLAEIWSELLCNPKIGIHDDFFKLGGHSLLATQVLSRVQAEFQVEIPLQVLFSGITTIAQIAKMIEQSQIQQADADLLSAALEKLGQLSDEEVKSLLAMR
jgi:acyl carrier protein